MKTLVLLSDVLARSGLEPGFSGAGVAAGTFVGNWSSRKPCQIILGGLLRTLKRANWRT